MICMHPICHNRTKIPLMHAAANTPGLGFIARRTRVLFMGIMTKAFVVAPLAVFAAIIFGFAIYNTLCKNSSVAILNC